MSDMLQLMLYLLSNAVKFCDSANGWVEIALIGDISETKNRDIRTYEHTATS